ncbi:MAG: hypothetical protein KME64_02955 [Scytonematopsis contorta HA4267-MV1]|jgi:hypothetical protein|nr:hypothetical protein [Scytonematopsis contorta HA4267-MV1]
MDTKTKRLLLLVISCSAAGVILGGVTSWGESSLCLQNKDITSECITQNPLNKALEGMGNGLLAGAGAAFGVAWQLRHDN